MSRRAPLPHEPPTRGCRPLTAAHLEDERGAGLQFQEAGGAERLQHGVRVVEEGGGVEHQQGAHVVHDEAQLVGPLPQLGRGARRVVHGRGAAHHGGVVVHQAALGTQARTLGRLLPIQSGPAQQGRGAAASPGVHTPPPHPVARATGAPARTHILPFDASVLGPDTGFADGGQVGARDG